MFLPQEVCSHPLRPLKHACVFYYHKNKKKKKKRKEERKKKKTASTSILEAPEQGIYRHVELRNDCFTRGSGVVAMIRVSSYMLAPSPSADLFFARKSRVPARRQTNGNWCLGIGTISKYPVLCTSLTWLKKKKKKNWVEACVIFARIVDRNPGGLVTCHLFWVFFDLFWVLGLLDLFWVLGERYISINNLVTSCDMCRC